LPGLEGEVPAAVADPFGGFDLRGKRGGGGDQLFQIAGLLARPRPGKLQYPLGLVRADRFQFNPVRVDQHQPVGLFKHGVGRAFDDIDGKRVGQLD